MTSSGMAPKYQFTFTFTCMLKLANIFHINFLNFNLLALQVRLDSMGHLATRDHLDPWELRELKARTERMVNKVPQDHTDPVDHPEDKDLLDSLDKTVRHRDWWIFGGFLNIICLTFLAMTTPQPTKNIFEILYQYWNCILSEIYLKRIF